MLFQFLGVLNFKNFGSLFLLLLEFLILLGHDHFVLVHVDLLLNFSKEIILTLFFFLFLFLRELLNNYGLGCSLSQRRLLDTLLPLSSAMRPRAPWLRVVFVRLSWGIRLFLVWGGHFHFRLHFLVLLLLCFWWLVAFIVFLAVPRKVLYFKPLSSLDESHIFGDQFIHLFPLF